MIFKKQRSNAQSFTIPLLSTVAIGTAITVAYYAMLHFGPLNFALLKRYCLCHPVAIVTVWLFFLNVVILARKIYELIDAKKYAQIADKKLRDLLATKDEQATKDPAQWLALVWKTQTTAILQSWLGQRLTQIVDLQVKRGNLQKLDDDMQALAGQDADRQYDSYGLIRMATWAMPMLGFLGTVLGISDTLGQMDMQLLASGSQEALNNMTSGLYVAFDTTAIALALTMLSMFMQFAVNRSELQVLTSIDTSLHSNLVSWLTEEEEVIPRTADEMVQRLVDHLGTIIQSVVTQQATLWKETIDEARMVWTQSTANATIEAQRALAGAIDASLDRHSQAIDDSLDRHARSIDQSTVAGAAQIEARWQQWQTTLSEQARLMHHQQAEVARQSELICKLIDKSSDLENMDRTIDQSLSRLTDVDRFHEAAVCMTEAVAFIATQLERQGMLGRKSARTSEPRVADQASTADTPTTIPFRKEQQRRRAG